MILRLLIALLAGGASLPALAAPVVVSVISNFVVYGTAWTTAAYVAVIAVAASYAYSKAQQRSAERQQRKAENDAQQDRLVNLRTATAPRKLCFGRVRVGGAVLYPATIGRKKEIFYLVLELAAHEIDALEAVLFDGEEVTLGEGGTITSGKWARKTRRTASTPVQLNGQGVPMYANAVPGSIYVTYTAGEEGVVVPLERLPSGLVMMPNIGGNGTLHFQLDETSPVARVWARLGKPGDPGDVELRAQLPGVAHRYEGIACLVVRLEYDDEIFQQPPVVTARFRGMKGIDPRTPTAGPVWSDNPAVLAYWAATHPMCGGLTDDDIDMERLIAAANACDTPTQYVVGGQLLPVRKMFTAGYVHYCDSANVPESTIDILVEAMAGRKDWERGRLAIVAGVYQPVAGTITADWVANAGGISSGSGQTIGEVFNSVNGKFWGQDANDEWVDYPRVAPDVWAEQDNGDHPKNINLEAVQHTGQAQHVVSVLLRDARQDDTLTMTLLPVGHALQIFKTYKIMLPRFGIKGKEYLLLKKRWTLGGALEVSFKETGAAIFDQATGFPAIDYLPNSDFPSWAAMPEVQILTITSGDDDIDTAQDGTVVTRMVVRWAVTRNPRIEAIEVQWALAPATEAQPEWASLTAPEAVGLLAIDAVVDKRLYLVRIRTVGALAFGPWSTQGVHPVKGKSAPPAPVTAFSVVENGNGTRAYAWTYANPPRDLAAFDIRYKAGANQQPAFESMTSLAQPQAAARSLERSAPAAGDWTFAICAVDTSGNRSLPFYSGQSIQPEAAPDETLTSLSPADLQWYFNIATPIPNTPHFVVWLGNVVNGSALGGDAIAHSSQGGQGGTPPDPLNPNFWLAYTFLYQDSRPGNRLYRLSVKAISDGVVDYQVSRMLSGGASGLAYEPIGDSQFLANLFSVRIRTQGLRLSDLRINIYEGTL